MKSMEIHRNPWTSMEIFRHRLWALVSELCLASAGCAKRKQFTSDVCPYHPTRACDVIVRGGFTTHGVSYATRVPFKVNRAAAARQRIRRTSRHIEQRSTNNDTLVRIPRCTRHCTYYECKCRRISKQISQHGSVGAHH